MGQTLDKSVRMCTGGASAAAEDDDEVNQTGQQQQQKTLEEEAVKIATTDDATGNEHDAQGDDNVDVKDDTPIAPIEEGEKTPPASTGVHSKQSAPEPKEEVVTPVTEPTPTAAVVSPDVEVPGAQESNSEPAKEEPEAPAQPVPSKEEAKKEEPLPKQEVQKEEAPPKQEVQKDEASSKEVKSEAPKQKTGFWSTLFTRKKEAAATKAPVDEKAVESEEKPEEKGVEEAQVEAAPASPVAVKDVKESAAASAPAEGKKASALDRVKSDGAPEPSISVGKYGNNVVEETEIEVEVEGY